MAHATHHAPAGQGVRDPVCGMTVDPATTPHRTPWDGRDWFFCSARCVERFRADPTTELMTVAFDWTK